MMNRTMYVNKEYYPQLGYLGKVEVSASNRVNQGVGLWMPLILFILLNEEFKRFGELRRLLPNVTQGMLTNQLRGLERDGLIIRKVYQTIPPKVEYSLSEHGKTLSSVLTDMCGWGFHHMDFMNGTGTPDDNRETKERV